METTPVMRNNEGFWLRRRLAWAGGIAFVGCAVSCSIPFLAMTVGGSVLTAAAALVRPGAELVVGIVAFAGALAVMALHHRRKAQQARACGCAVAAAPKRLFESPEVSPDEPVVCTADLRDKPTVQRGIDSYRAAFAHL